MHFSLIDFKDNQVSEKLFFIVDVPFCLQGRINIGFYLCSSQITNRLKLFNLGLPSFHSECCFLLFSFFRKITLCVNFKSLINCTSNLFAAFRFLLCDYFTALHVTYLICNNRSVRSYYIRS